MNVIKFISKYKWIILVFLIAICLFVFFNKIGGRIFSAITSLVLFAQNKKKDNNDKYNSQISNLNEQLKTLKNKTYSLENELTLNRDDEITIRERIDKTNKRISNMPLDAKISLHRKIIKKDRL